MKQVMMHLCVVLVSNSVEKIRISSFPVKSVLC